MRYTISHISVIRALPREQPMIEILWAPTTQEPTGLHNDFKQKIKFNEKGKASEAAPQAIQIFVFASHNSASLGTKKPTDSVCACFHYRHSFAACLHAATKLVLTKRTHSGKDSAGSRSNQDSLCGRLTGNLLQAKMCSIPIL